MNWLLKKLGNVLIIASIVWTMSNPAHGGDRWTELQQNTTAAVTATLDQLTDQLSTVTRWVWSGFVPSAPVELTIVYTPDKQGWLEWAAVAFARTPAGANIHLRLIPLESFAGAQAIMTGQQPAQVWMPANSVAREWLFGHWHSKHGHDPVLTDVSVALSPLVIALRTDRYEALQKHYQTVTLHTLVQAMSEPGGWATLADQPSWGLVKLRYPAPTRANSGLLTLGLFTYDFFGFLDRHGVVQPQDLLTERFIQWMQQLTYGLQLDLEPVEPLLTSGASPMVPPVTGQVTYENVVLQMLADPAYANPSSDASAKPPLTLVYPARTFWNDHPFYLLDMAWCQEAHRQAASAFLQFLLSDEAQRVARDQFWFRPVAAHLAITDEDSAFRRYPFVKVDVLPIKSPPPKTLQVLVQIWQRFHPTWAVE